MLDLPVLLQWIRDTLGPASTGGPFPSVCPILGHDPALSSILLQFFGIHESYKRIKGSFGDSWQRLCEVKHKYDPQGFFTHSFWPLDPTDQPKTIIVRTHTEF